MNSRPMPFDWFSNLLDKILAIVIDNNSIENDSITQDSISQHTLSITQDYISQYILNENFTLIKNCRNKLDEYKKNHHDLSWNWDGCNLFLKFNHGKEKNYTTSDKNNLYLYADGENFFYYFNDEEDNQQNNDGTARKKNNQINRKKYFLEDHSQLTKSLQEEFKTVNHHQPTKCITGRNISDEVIKITSKKGHTCGNSIYIRELENEIYSILSNIIDHADKTDVLAKIKYQAERYENLKKLNQQIIITDRIERILDYIDSNIKVNEESLNHLKIAEQLENENKFEEAIITYQKLNLREKEKVVWKKYGDSLLQNKKCDEAISVYTNAININPNSNDAEIYFSLAKAYDQRRQRDGDKATYKQGLKPIDYFSDASRDLNEDFKCALENYDKAIDLNPKNALYFYTRGKLLSCLNKPSIKNNFVIEDYSEAIKLNPDCADFYAARSKQYFKSSKLPEALIDCYEASQRKFDDQKLFKLINEQLQKQLNEGVYGFEDKAWKLVYEIRKITNIKLRSKVLAYALNKSSPLGKWFQLHTRISSELFKIESDVIKSMSEEYNYLNAGEKFLNQNNLPGDVFLQKNQYQEAISAYTKTLAQNPEASYARRGYAFYCNKQFSEAIDDFTNAINLNPKSSDYYFCRARSYAKRSLALKDEQTQELVDISIENFERAINDFKQAIRLDPSVLNAAADFCDCGELIDSLCLNKRYTNVVKVYLMFRTLNSKKPCNLFHAKYDFLEILIAIINIHKNEPIQSGIKNSLEIKNLINEILINGSTIEVYQQISNVTDDAVRLELLTYATDDNSPLKKWFDEHQLFSGCMKDMKKNHAFLLKHQNNNFSHTERAHALFEYGLYNQAIAEFSKSINEEPIDSASRTQSYLNRGKAFLKMGIGFSNAMDDFSEVISFYKKLLSCNTDETNRLNHLKNYAKAYHYRSIAGGKLSASSRGTLTEQIAKWEEAIQDCEKAIKLDPTFEDARITRRTIFQNYAQFHLNKSAKQNAVEVQTRIIELDPSAETYYNRAKTYFQFTKQSKLSDALIDCYQAYHCETLDKTIHSKGDELLKEYLPKNPEIVFEEIKKIEDEVLRGKVLSDALDTRSPLGKWFSSNTYAGSSFFPTGTLYKMKNYFKNLGARQVCRRAPYLAQAARQNFGHSSFIPPEIYASILCWIAGPDFNPAPIFDKYFKDTFPDTDRLSFAHATHCILFKPEQIKQEQIEDSENYSYENLNEQFENSNGKKSFVKN